MIKLKGLILETVTVDKDSIKPYIKGIIDYFEKEGVTVRPLPPITLVKDRKNANMPLGKTAHYDPNDNTIKLFILDRHMKDILRSFAHELVHHNQRLSNPESMNGINTTNINNSKDLEALEKDAYTRGNMLFRAWENALNAGNK